MRPTGFAAFPFPLTAVLAGVAVISGCRHPMADYENSLIAGNYVSAASIATEEAKDGDNDELMWRLMAGSARRLAGETETAIAQFDKAEDVMIEHDGASVFSKGMATAWAMVTNDKAFPYDGGGQDRIMTCFYKAVDFAATGKPEAARTEFNRAAQHQENWLSERRKEIADAKERLDRDAEAYRKEKQPANAAAAKAGNIDGASVVNGAFANAGFAAQVKAQGGFDMATDGVLDALRPADWMNPYVSHVTGVFRWLNGDAARDYLKDAAACRTDNPVAVRDFSECDRGGKPRNQVWVWVEEGLGPKREEWRIDLPLVLVPYVNRFVMYAGMAFPKLVSRASAGENWQVVTASGATHMSELVDMDAKMKLEFDVYFRGALVREITRTTVKIGTQVALGVVAEGLNDDCTRTALWFSQAAAAAWAASMTGADTRSWTALPKKVHAMRVDRPADGKVRIANGYGDVAQITVPQGNTMVFVSKPSVQAPAAVRIVTYP